MWWRMFVLRLPVLVIVIALQHSWSYNNNYYVRIRKLRCLCSLYGIRPLHSYAKIRFRDDSYSCAWSQVTWHYHSNRWAQSCFLSCRVTTVSFEWLVVQKKTVFVNLIDGVGRIIIMVILFHIVVMKKRWIIVMRLHSDPVQSMNYFMTHECAFLPRF